ncbi:hypothetical protein BDV18DRAFT_164861 [Aspergillus unguis]
MPLSNSYSLLAWCHDVPVDIGAVLGDDESDIDIDIDIDEVEDRDRDEGEEPVGFEEDIDSGVDGVASYASILNRFCNQLGLGLWDYLLLLLLLLLLVVKSAWPPARPTEMEMIPFFEIVDIDWDLCLVSLECSVRTLVFWRVL